MKSFQATVPKLRSSCRFRDTYPKPVNQRKFTRMTCFLNVISSKSFHPKNAKPGLRTAFRFYISISTTACTSSRFLYRSTFYAVAEYTLKTCYIFFLPRIFTLVIPIFVFQASYSITLTAIIPSFDRFQPLLYTISLTREKNYSCNLAQ